MTNADLQKLVAKSLTCASLPKHELRFLHALHLRLLAGDGKVNHEERLRVLEILAHQGEREARQVLRIVRS